MSEQYANIITGAGPVDAIPGGVADGIDYHGAPPWPIAHKAGWRRLPSRAVVPTGQVVSKRMFEQGTKTDDAIERVETIPLAEYDASQAAAMTAEADNRLASDAALKRLMSEIVALKARVAAIEKAVPK